MFHSPSPSPSGSTSILSLPTQSTMFYPFNSESFFFHCLGLGNLRDGAADIKKHPWFKGINWKDVAERKLRPPYIPELNGEGDTSNFVLYDEEEEDQDVPPVEEDLFPEF